MTQPLWSFLYRKVCKLVSLIADPSKNILRIELEMNQELIVGISRLIRNCADSSRIHSLKNNYRFAGGHSRNHAPSAKWTIGFCASLGKFYYCIPHNR